MNEVAKWFAEAIDYGLKVYNENNSQYIFYKGFKLIKNHDSEYFIQDIRVSDFYRDVDEKHLSIIRNRGLIRGADDISYHRNIKRVERYTKKVESLYEDLDKFVAKGDLRKIENCRENIKKYLDLMFFYKAKIHQYNNKYKLNLSNNE